jgi:AbrB family transcriptional regulator, stage V sporulation protein T
MSYHGKVISGGKVVVPAELRRALGFTDGESVVFERNGESVVIKTYAQVVREVQAAVKAMIKEPFTVDDFIADRRAEAERE